VSSNWELVCERTGGTVAGLLVCDAGVLALTTAAVHLSVDDGATWSTLSAGELGAPLNALAYCDAGIFIGGQTGLARSRDMGCSWSHMLGGDPVVCLAVALDAGRRTLLAGTQSEGMLRSEDDGATWASANPGLFDSMVQCLAVTPGGVCLAGTPTGVYRSTNAGRSWRESELPCGPVSVECLAVSEQLVLAGSDSAGAYVSRDGARTWSRVVALEELAATAAAIAAGDALLAVGAPSGVYVSHDGGGTWRFDKIGTLLSLVCLDDCLLAGVAGDGILQLDLSSDEWRQSSAGLHGRVVVDLACGSRSDTLLTADLEGGVHRSTDGGRSWQLTDTAPTAPSHLANGAGVVYASSTAGLAVSRDDGQTWSVVHSDSAALAVAAAPTGIALAAFDDQQLVVFENGQPVRAMEWDSFARGRVLAVAVAELATLFVATLGERSVVWRSNDAGQLWSAWFVADSVQSMCIAVSPTFAVDEQVLVGAGTSVYRPLRQTRERRGRDAHPLWLGTSLSDTVTAIAFGPTSDIVYAATTSGVQLSRDGAQHFDQWAQSLPARSPVLAVQQTPQTIYALCFGGALWRRAS
jgi:photosystem II stability/assembly factor-like uncharacterized protein